MGWTSYRASHYNKKGQVDRKAECDAIFEKEKHCRVLASSMVGTVYYSAVEFSKLYKGRNENGESVYEDLEKPVVTAYVILTSCNNEDIYNFSYKDMHESMGPAYYRCPQKILKLLTPTDSEYANEWRNECAERAKRTDYALSKARLGSKVKCNINGKEVTFTKTKVPQYKRPIWLDEKTYTRIKTTSLMALGYEFVE